MDRAGLMAIWAMLATVVAAWLGWRWLRERRGGRKSDGLTDLIVAALSSQALLFPHEIGTRAAGRAADRFSTGYVFGFAVSMLISAGKRDMATLPPILNAIFEGLFGEGEGRRAFEHGRMMKRKDKEAMRGAEAGRGDARRYIESGGQRSVTGWLQYVRADLFADMPSAGAVGANASTSI